MAPEEAAELLGTARRAGQRTRSQLAALSWLPWVMFGVLALLAAPISWIWSGAFDGIYWAVATPVVVTFTAWRFHRRELHIGLESRAGPTFVAVGVIVIGAFGSGTIGGIFGMGMLAAIGPAIAVAAGLLIFGRLQRSAAPALAGGVIVMVAATLLAANADARVASTVLLVVCGLSGIAVGVQHRRSAGGER